MAADARVLSARRNGAPTTVSTAGCIPGRPSRAPGRGATEPSRPTGEMAIKPVSCMVALSTAAAKAR